MKDYKFTTIPRFMVFDREGKVVSTNFPVPESELKIIGKIIEFSL